MNLPEPLKYGLLFTGIITVGMGAVMLTFGAAKKFAQDFKPKNEKKGIER